MFHIVYYVHNTTLNNTKQHPVVDLNLKKQLREIPEKTCIRDKVVVRRYFIKSSL